MTIHFGKGKHLCEILSRCNLAEGTFDPDTDFGFVCTVTLTLEMQPWVNVMTQFWVMDNNDLVNHPRIIQAGSNKSWLYTYFGCGCTVNLTLEI